LRKQKGWEGSIENFRNKTLTDRRSPTILFVGLGEKAAANIRFVLSSARSNEETGITRILQTGVIAPPHKVEIKRKIIARY
jgi:hypothetical protein